MAVNELSCNGSSCCLFDFVAGGKVDVVDDGDLTYGDWYLPVWLKFIVICNMWSLEYYVCQGDMNTIWSQKKKKIVVKIYSIGVLDILSWLSHGYY